MKVVIVIVFQNGKPMAPGKLEKLQAPSSRHHHHRRVLVVWRHADRAQVMEPGDLLQLLDLHAFPIDWHRHEPSP